MDICIFLKKNWINGLSTNKQSHNLSYVKFNKTQTCYCVFRKKNLLANEGINF